jgi:endonuclease/exonuclease/phosphatase family metal-dependent hydrolase
MLRVMFWNVGNAPVEVIAHVTKSESIDILVLAELRHGAASCLKALNAESRLTYHANLSQCPRIAIYSRLSDQYLSPAADTKYMTVRVVKPPIGRPFLLVGVHMRSKLHQSSESHGLSLLPAAHEIRAAEDRLGTQRTVVVGDFNADPYETSIVAATGFHAVMTRQRAQRGARTVGGIEQPFFYNPMWSYLGDLSQGPPGTYHYSHGEEAERFWHSFDQVLLRPAMLEHFREGSVRVVTQAGSLSLANRDGYPDADKLSDHFPVVLTLYM